MNTYQVCIVPVRYMSVSTCQECVYLPGTCLTTRYVYEYLPRRYMYDYLPGMWLCLPARYVSDYLPGMCLLDCLPARYNWYMSDYLSGMCLPARYTCVYLPGTCLCFPDSHRSVSTCQVCVCVYLCLWLPLVV